MTQNREPFTIAKLDAAQNLVFGFANVGYNVDGSIIQDLQGDEVTVEDMEPAAYDFVVDVRKSGEMHEGDANGVLVESLYFTPEKLKALGLPEDAIAKGAWWIGFRVSPDVFAKVAKGDYRMFSIQGRADRVKVDA